MIYLQRNPKNVYPEMAESTIITGQFVRISQTPASIGERLMALIIDYFLIGLYILSTITLLSKLSLPSGFSLFFFLCVVYLPVQIGRASGRERVWSRV